MVAVVGGDACARSLVDRALNHRHKGNMGGDACARVDDEEEDVGELGHGLRLREGSGQQGSGGA